MLRVELMVVVCWLIARLQLLSIVTDLLMLQVFITVTVLQEVKGQLDCDMLMVEVEPPFSKVTCALLLLIEIDEAPEIELGSKDIAVLDVMANVLAESDNETGVPTPEEVNTAEVSWMLT